jgi:DNA-binding response OmpR family regulator
VTATDTLDGLKKLYETHPNVIIVSAGLTLLNGESPYWLVRQASYVPILVLGASEEAAEMLEHGADAYMIKPLNINELVARVNSLLRRRPKVDTPGDDFGPVMENYLTSRENSSNGLSPTEFRLASCLVLNRGRLLDYSRLTNEVWGGRAVSRNTIHFYIRRLRRKLTNIIILGLRGIGYYLPESNRGNEKDNHQ